MSALLELSRPMPIDRIGAGWSTMDVVATEAECLAVAARLHIEAVSTLSCQFRLRRDPGDHLVVLAEGQLAAVVAQICVVTLEPFEAPVSERFRLRFVPDGQETPELDPDADDEIPYATGMIDLGEAAVEQLALSLDPFPRRPDAVLPDDLDAAPDNPFAALAGRRKPD